MTTDQPAPRSRTWLLLLPLGLIFLGLLVWANYHYLNTPKYVHRDFMSLWGGGRALLEGLDPYDPDVWSPLRTRYGSKWLPDPKNPFPLWTLMFVLPFSAVDFGWGAAAWLVLSQLLLGLCVFQLAITLGGRRPSVFDFALLALGAFALRGTLVTFHNGQITVWLLLVITLFLVFLKRDLPFVAGFALAFIILKPNPFILFAPLLALWLLWQRRWTVIAGGLLGGGLLLGASWLVIPGWPFEWLGATEKTIATFITPTVWGVAGDFAFSTAPLLGLALAVAVTVVTGWAVFHDKRLDVLWVVSLALTGSLLITPYAWAYEHMLLLVPLILLFTRLSRWLAWPLWIGLVLVLPWLLYRASELRGSGTIEILAPLLTALVVLTWLALGRGARRRAPAVISPALVDPDPGLIET